MPLRVFYSSKILDTKAQLILTSTITHENYLWDLYQRGQANDPLVKSWMWPTPMGPYFQGAYGKQRLADFRSLYDEQTWNSECLCIPTKDGSKASFRIYPVASQKRSTARQSRPDRQNGRFTLYHRP